jgi:quercetin dioxygenase-like cupin family protein
MATRSNSEAKAVELVPGVIRRTLVHGDHTSLHQLHMEKDSVVPVHTHPHEQIGYVASGRIEFEIDGVKTVLSAGDGYLIPGGVPHGVVTLEDAICVDIFSPVRTEYLDD